MKRFITYVQACIECPEGLVIQYLESSVEEGSFPHDLSLCAECFVEDIKTRIIQNILPVTVAMLASVSRANHICDIHPTTQDLSRVAPVRFNQPLTSTMEKSNITARRVCWRAIVRDAQAMYLP